MALEPKKTRYQSLILARGKTLTHLYKYFVLKRDAYYKYKRREQKTRKWISNILKDKRVKTLSLGNIDHKHTLMNKIMPMKNIYLLLLSILFITNLWATTHSKDTIKVTAKTTVTDLAHLDQVVRQLTKVNNTNVVNTLVSSQYRSFPELNTYNFSNNANNNEPLPAEFTEEYLKNVLKTDNKTDSIINAAKNIFKEIMQQEKFIDKMTGNELIELPVGIRKRLAGGKDADGNLNANDQHTSITIGVIKAKLFPEYSELDLFAKLEIGPLNTTLFLGASRVKLSHQGGIYGEARLNLLADVPVAQNGGQWLLTFKGGLKDDGSPKDETYITIDCEGKVKEVAIAADVRIAKSVAVPIKEDGSYMYPNKVTPNANESPVNNPSYLGAGFRVNLTSIEDLIVQVNLPRFELKKLPKWGFLMKNAILDLSDTRNATTNMIFPPVYTQQQLLVPGNEQLWRGFYSEDISIMLPPEFKKKDSKERITVGAQNLIIDNFGVSGNFYARNVLDLNEGDASKWQFSLDNLEVDVQVNQFVKAKFDGSIVLPVSEKVVVKDSITNEKDTLKIAHGGLKYRGLISADRNYSLRVDIQDDVDFNIFKAKAKLFRDSYVKLEVKNDKFLPEANLTGLMAFKKPQKAAMDTLSNKSGNIEDIDFSGLSFQNFKIQTATRPYLSIKYMGYKDSISLPKIYGFQLGFYDVKATTDVDDSAEIAFNSFINLDKSGIKGDVRLRIMAHLEDGDYLRWKYKKTEVDAVKIDVSRKSFEFRGELNFFRNDSTYSKGLAGNLDLYSNSLKIKLGAKGMFGNVDNYRYWYVDAYGKPTSTSGNKNFVIYELGGGLYHHMRKAGYDEYGKTMSGVYYMPDKGTKLGFKALASFEVKKSATFTGLVALEMSFNSEENGGGVSRIGFYGAAALMSGKNTETGSTGKKEPFGDMASMQKKLADKERTIPNLSSMSIDKEGIKYFSKNVFPDMLTGQEKFVAQVGIDFDYANEAYWGMFDIRMNAGKIKGGGYLEFYNSKTDWYIYIGEPEKRIEVENIPIGPFDASVNLYFMTGTDLPAPAKPDPIVIDILDLTEEELNFGRNFENGLAQGTGFAFGATFRLGKSFDWGIVYASVQAGVGFDLMIRNFGDATCRGSEERVGIDGWYATGQLYAYLKGDIGVQIKIFGSKKKVRILEAGIATLAQGQFPNPWYLVGYAGFKVRVLGLVTVKGRLKIVIGEECEIVGKTGIQNVTVISDIVPSDGEKDIDVFDAIQVAFNAPMEDELIVEEANGRKIYRVSLKSFEVKENDNVITGSLAWNNQNDLLTFESDDVLPPQKNITVLVKIAFEEKVNGVWKLVTDDKGNVTVEEKTVVFTTGNAPTYIPYKNITSMYPIIDQKYMFPKESNRGHVQLIKGQDYLFGVKDYKDELFFIDENKEVQQVKFTYDKVENIINFDLPNKLKNEQQYTYRLLTSKIASNQQATTVIDSVKVNDNIAMSTNTVSGKASTDAFFERLTFTFNTSKYNTLEKKLKRMTVNDYYTLIGDTKVNGQTVLLSQVGVLGLSINDHEPFGINDIKGTVYTGFKPLLRLEGIPEDFYYINDIYPLIYKNYPLDGEFRVDRDENVLGVPPMKSLELTNTYSHYASYLPNSNRLRTIFPYRWNLAHTYHSDFKYLQYKLINKYPEAKEKHPNIYKKYGNILYGIFPYLRKEYYKVKVEYVLPNKQSGNATTIKYKNEF